MTSVPEDISEMIGMPFALEFTDAIKGSPVSIEGLKGKVVVIDFWASWCGPCVAEMPNMKRLYAEYKDKGVEFIGVSLDQPKERGGLDSLKSFVAKNQIEWPQYYQGNFWQSWFLQLLARQLDPLRVPGGCRGQAGVGEGPWQAREADPGVPGEGQEVGRGVHRLDALSLANDSLPEARSVPVN